MQDVNLYHLLKFYAKNWIWIVSITFIGLIIGFVYSNLIQVPMYKSEATLLLVRSNSSYSGTTQDVTLINNYVELFKSRRVLDPVISKQNLKISYDDLVGSVDASSSKNTEVIKVAYSAKNPETSRDFLSAAVDSFKTQVNQLYKSDNVKVVDSASLTLKPYNIHKELITMLAAVTGFVSTMIVLFFIYDYRLLKGAKKPNNPEPKNDEPVKVSAEILPVEEPQKIISKPEEVTNTSQILQDNARKARDRLFQTSYSRERHPRR